LDLLHCIHSHSSGLQAIIALPLFLHTFQFTVAHTLGFSVFTSCILAMDFSQSHCHFKSHMKSSFHSLIPFLPLSCNCQFRILDLVQFVHSQVHIPAGWRPELNSSIPTAPVLSCLTHPYNHFAWTTQKTRPLLLR
jgi:hypothetical protein